MMHRRSVRAMLVALILVMAFTFKGLLLVPSAPSTGHAFDTSRAIERLQRILGDERPHPVDTPANDAVRARIVEELRALGLDFAVREKPDCSGLPGQRTISCSLTRNIVAVIGAGRPGKALLLNAHYDSTPTGPGAADDGIGVATLLEVAATLQRQPPRQPVILLFNEGEEFGLNGAAAFAEGDPLAKRVGSLINLEARGVSGPAWMFETSEPNGAAIAAFAASSRRPYANSLSADFVKLIPNYTDVVIFKQAAHWRTLSFAIVGNETRYHSPGDTVAALDRSSVQHLGDEVLAATRTLGADRAESRFVYADIAGRVLLVLPFLAAAILLGGLIIVAAFRCWQVSALRRPLIAVAASIIAGIAAAFVTSMLAGFIRPGDFWRSYPLVTYLAVYATTIAAQWAVFARIGGADDLSRLRASAWLFILVIGGLLSLAVPGAMIFFLFAPGLALAATILPEGWRNAVHWVAALLHLLMFAELAASIEMLLIDGPIWAVGPVAALAALPLLVEAVKAPPRLFVAGFALLALGLWVAAMIVPRASIERPGAITISYVRDDDRNAAHWAIATKQAPLPVAFDRFGPWKRATLPDSGRLRWIADAPVFAVPAPTIERVGERDVGNGRHVRLRLVTNGADTVALQFPAAVAVRAMGLPGSLRPVPRGDRTSTIRCSGRACDGMIVDVLLGTQRPVAAQVIATRHALPPAGTALQRLRPRNAHPQYGPDASVGIATTTL